MPTKAEKTRNQIIALFATGLSYAEIAEKAECSRRTVIRVVKAVKSDLAELEEDQLAEYQKLLRKRLPIKDRVDLYDKIARKVDKNPFAAMRALERADDLDGVMTKKDQLRLQPEIPREPVPMLIFPPGTTIDIGQQVGVKKQINVTPDNEPVKMFMNFASTENRRQVLPVAQDKPEPSSNEAGVTPGAVGSLPDPKGSDEEKK